jgi:dihydroxy-acid dehydratase
MDAKLNLEAKLPSRHVTEGRDRPPQRAFHCEQRGIAFDLCEVAEIFKRTPHVADLKPAGRDLAKDMFEAGGVPLLTRTLLDHGTGRTVTETLKRVKRNKDQSVVHPADKPLSASSGVSGFKGSLAPRGATTKVAGLADLQFTGSVRCFGGEEACLAAVKNKTYREGEVLVIRYEGPQGGPGMREMLATTVALYAQSTGRKVALVTGGRSGATRAFCIGQVDGAAEAMCYAAV